MFGKSDDIIRGVNNKEYSAWESLYARYYKALCSYANSLLKDGLAAEDIVQDTLVRIWQSEIHFRDARELTSYLYKAVYNNSMVHIRNTGNREGILSIIQKENDRELRTQIEHDAEVNFGFLAGMVGEEVIRELYLSIQELPADRREIMQLSISGLSGAEIARKLGISLNTVKTQKYRSYKFLKKKLNKYYFLLAFLCGIN